MVIQGYFFIEIFMRVLLMNNGLESEEFLSISFPLKDSKANNAHVSVKGEFHYFYAQSLLLFTQISQS